MTSDHDKAIGHAMRAAAPVSHDRSVGPQVRGESARSPRVRRCDVDNAGLGSLAGRSSHGPGVHRAVGGCLDALIVVVLFSIRIRGSADRYPGGERAPADHGTPPVRWRWRRCPNRNKNHVGLSPGATGVPQGGGQTGVPVAGRGVAASRCPWRIWSRHQFVMPAIRVPLRGSENNPA